jgi:predicted ribonuclease toxin of YeeF-YezG toxin-antitoxin module
VKVYEAKTLIDSMEARSKEYNELRDKLEQVKRTCHDIVNLDDQLKGKGADAIKSFYQAQVDVVDAWLRLVDRNIAFFNGIAGNAEDVDLSGNTVVHVPLLEDELSTRIKNHKEMVSSQQEDLEKILKRIDDLVPLTVFSKDSFEDHIDKAEKHRKDTIDAVDQLDNDLKSEYILSEGDEQYVIGLFQQLMEASRQGNTIQPIHFNAEAYKASDVYKLKEQAEKQTSDYLSFKDEQERFREQLKRQEELENRPWYEKWWDGAKTFTGEFTGYYDYLRASEGVDPVTGEKLSAGQRIAAAGMATAGMIPVVGWAGRIFKGGSAIYKTAKGMNAADKALDVYRTTNTFSKLEKAEMGIYGLVSANGFSEYLTGKDMFGNELTEEQKQNSLNQALGLLAVGGIAFAPQLVRNGKMIRDETIQKAHELATKTKAGAYRFMEDVKGGARILLNPNGNFAFADNVPNLPMNAMSTPSVRKELDGGLSKFSMSGVGKGAVDTSSKGNKELSRIDYLRDKYGRFSKEELNHRINLRGAVAQEVKRLSESGLTNREMGPAVAGTFDKTTGKYYFGINNTLGKIPEELHPLIEQRIINMPKDTKEGYTFTYGAGSHAEVYSLNEALLANPQASPSNLITHVVRSGKKLKPAGMMMPTCPHCNFITEGFEFSSEVKKIERSN